MCLLGIEDIYCNISVGNVFTALPTSGGRSLVKWACFALSIATCLLKQVVERTPKDFLDS